MSFLGWPLAVLARFRHGGRANVLFADGHIEGYRNVWIEIWTHAIGGISENDFILAAKIDRLDVALKAPR